MSSASVKVDGRVTGSIQQGLVVFVGIGRTDNFSDASYIVNKVVNMRLFDNSDGMFDLSALDIHSQFLIVSQFTLYAQTRKGRRPSFVDAMPPGQARDLYEQTVELFRESGLAIETGVFKSHRDVSLTNDGPVTIRVDSSDNGLK
ncbi:MAG: D-aminoacyl-tRNA deacylase [Chloroflexota bacterium]|nr:MAG: D-aminoacyl-tRNA deacylase [Chloroflexota bacterium]